jgi:hypothetical protein
MAEMLKKNICRLKSYLLLFSFFIIVFHPASASGAAGYGFIPFENISHLKHSMADPFKYASSKIPGSIKKLIAAGRVSKLIVFHGGKENCLRYFKENRGGAPLSEFDDTFADGAKTSFYKITGSEIYIDYKNYGRDMAVHKALLYHFAGLGAANLEIIAPEDGGASNPLFYESVKAAGRCDFAVIGYVRSFVRDFTLRKTAFEKAKFLRDHFAKGLNRLKTGTVIKRLLLRDRARAGANRQAACELRGFFRAVELIADSDPAMFFRDSRYYFALAELEAALVKTSREGLDEIFTQNGFKYYPVNGKYNFKAGEYVHSAGFDIRRFDAVVKGGAKKRILIARHPYGEQARCLAEELYSAGARRMLFLGSCGGFDEGLRTGDILVSRMFYRFDERGRFHGPCGANDAWRFFKSAADKSGPDGGQPLPYKNRVEIKDYHVSVPSPLIETRRTVNDFIAGKISSVDCESFYLFENKPASRSAGAVFIVTDLPLKEHTLESYDSNSPAMLEAQMRALDLVIQYFGIEDIAVD